MKTFILVLSILLCSINCIAQKRIIGKVIRVADGDTFTIIDSMNIQIRIRFHGIDCPEKGQDYYQVAKDFTSEKAFGKIVIIDDLGNDRYGRKIGKVWINDTTMLNLELLKVGLAWHYINFDKSIEFSEAERSARAKKLNIWSMPDAIEPWNYRKNN